MIVQNNKTQVIDVRDPASYQAGHIEGAVHVDNSNLQRFIEAADKTLPLIVCCYHGNMSKNIADFFHKQGFEKSFSLDGGYAQWSEYR